jgi:Na+:H+ antiporter, NhaA family
VHLDSESALLGKEQSSYKRSSTSIMEFIRTEAGGGLILVICAAVALIWSNSRWSDDYFDLLQTPVQIGARSFGLTMSLHHWINDALMVVFFLVVGLEIKRELLIGELASRDKAAIPVAAAIGGAAIPALFYLALNRGEGKDGWGIPMATDIAFALGVLALVASKAPIGLRVFLMALAIVDDLIAIMVIAVFYTSSIRFAPLGVAAGCLVILIVMNRFQSGHPSFFFLIGIILWLGLLKSGVHATIAGVLIAMCVPVSNHRSDDEFLDEMNELVREYPGIDEHEQRELVINIEHIAERITPPAQRLIHTLHPWVAYLIIPVFAIANSGVALDGASLTGPIPLGVLLGLVLGKPIGITLATAVMLRLGVGALPTGMRFSHVPALAALAGIGFTMSLFISDLAFESVSLIDEAKIGILVSSLIAAIVGSIAIWTTLRNETEDPLSDQVVAA